MNTSEACSSTHIFMLFQFKNTVTYMQGLSYQQKTNTDSIRCYEIKYFLNLPLGKIPFGELFLTTYNLNAKQN